MKSLILIAILNGIDKLIMDLIINLEDFNKELLKTKSERNRLIFIKKYILHGIPVIFENRENEYFEFRNKIAEKFNVGFHEVFIQKICAKLKVKNYTIKKL